MYCTSNPVIHIQMNLLYTSFTVGWVCLHWYPLIRSCSPGALIPPETLHCGMNVVRVESVSYTVLGYQAASAWHGHFVSHHILRLGYAPPLLHSFLDQSIKVNSVWQKEWRTLFQVRFANWGPVFKTACTTAFCRNMQKMP